MVAEVGSDELDEVGGIVEAVGVALPIFLADGRISTQGEDVTNALQMREGKQQEIMTHLF